MMSVILLFSLSIIPPSIYTSITPLSLILHGSFPWNHVSILFSDLFIPPSSIASIYHHLSISSISLYLSPCSYSSIIPSKNPSFLLLHPSVHLYFNYSKQFYPSFNSYFHPTGLIYPLSSFFLNSYIHPFDFPLNIPLFIPRSVFTSTHHSCNQSYIFFLSLSLHPTKMKGW